MWNESLACLALSNLSGTLASQLKNPNFDWRKSTFSSQTGDQSKTFLKQRLRLVINTEDIQEESDDLDVSLAVPSSDATGKSKEEKSNDEQKVDFPYLLDLSLLFELSNLTLSVNQTAVQHLARTICKLTSRDLYGFAFADEFQDQYGSFISCLLRFLQMGDVATQHYGFLTLINFVMKVSRDDAV